MIAASGLLVAVAFVTLIVGVFSTGLSLIWVSIASSILAAVFLALGVAQGNRRRLVTAGGPSTPAWGEGSVGTAVIEREPAVRSTFEEAPPPLTIVPEPEETLIAAPAPAKTRSAGAARPTSRASAATAAEVVVIPDRDKFHRESCRYAKNPAAMTMAKAAARKQGYKPCGVCKP